MFTCLYLSHGHNSISTVWLWSTDEYVSFFILSEGPSLNILCTRTTRPVITTILRYILFVILFLELIVRPHLCLYWCFYTRTNLCVYAALCEQTYVYTWHCVNKPMGIRDTVWTNLWVYVALCEQTYVYTWHCVNKPMCIRDTVWTNLCVNATLFEQSYGYTWHCVNKHMGIRGTRWTNIWVYVTLGEHTYGYTWQ